ncbi:MAG: protein kinase domain-containing protein [Anaerolineales bacterium]
MTLENGFLLKQRYRIEGILGQGGMGAVYRAIDENLDITVAVKENTFFSEEYARQFQREAKILASLRHPNLPRVFDYFVIEQQGQYLVMDFIEGDDLRQWMTREDMISEIEALHIGIEICNALIYLHSQVPPITHRDIKPGNIKITPAGEVILVDFGLVKQLSDQEITTTAARAMTPGYSPPEQYGPTPTDRRSDIFSLGATLYASLAGYLPEDSLARITGKAQLTPLEVYNPGISPQTIGVIEKAIALRFEDRWQSAEAFKQALLDAREAIPREKWTSRYFAISNQNENQAAINNQTNTKLARILQKFQHPFSIGKLKLEPIGIILGLVIFILISLLSISLLWPQSFQQILGQHLIASPTKAFFELSNPTQTEGQLIIDLEGTTTPSPQPSPTTALAILEQQTPSTTPTGGGAGFLAFVSERSGLPQLWLYNMGSGAISQLTDNKDGACQPDWSPDGKRLVFISPCQGKRPVYPGSSLFIIEVDTGRLNSLPVSLEGDFDPAWSPDGKWIAYTSLINGKMHLMKINLDHLTTVQLSDGSFEDSDPTWSPDGTQLAFVRFRGINQIWIMDQDGENPVQFTLSGPVNDSNPKWYAKENLILFSQALGTSGPSKQLNGMRLKDIGTAEEVLIIPANHSDYIPLMDNVDVSPDGIWIAFDYWYHNVLSDIYIMTFPSTNLTQLTDDPAMDYDAVWQPLP